MSWPVSSASGAPDLTTLIYIPAADPLPTLTLTDPNGNVSTPTSLQTGVQYLDLSAGDEFLPPSAGFSVTGPAAGTWTLAVTNPVSSAANPLDVSALFTVEATTGLAIASQTTADTYGAGQTVSLVSQVTQINADGSRTPVSGSSGATVTAQVTALDAGSTVAPQTVTPFDDVQHGEGAANDGIWGAIFPAAVTPGRYAAAITVSLAGEQRLDTTIFSVVPNPILTVTTTADPASCPTVPATQTPLSLRCAITQANLDGSGDTIAFNIPAAGNACSGTPAVCTITPNSYLPVITAPDTTIDGYTQPGASHNTLSVGDNATLTIRLDGAALAPTTTDSGIAGNAPHITVQGLVITRFPVAGVLFYGTSTIRDQAYGNFLGTDGTVALGNVHEPVLGVGRPEPRSVGRGPGSAT